MTTSAPAAIAYLPLLARLQGAFEAQVPAADPDALVPACDSWRVRDLVLHLAGVHQWAAGKVRGERVSDVVEPAGRDLVTVYAACAAELRATLAAVPPDAPVRTLAGPGPASFWHRRQVHETLVHLHDLRAAALGSGSAAAADSAADVGADVWTDAVDEVVTMFQPRQVRLGRAPALPSLVVLRALDTGRSWVLGGHEDDRDPDETPAGTATAPACGLALALWGRLDHEEAGLRLDGDASAVRAALAAPIVP